MKIQISSRNQCLFMFRKSCSLLVASSINLCGLCQERHFYVFISNYYLSPPPPPIFFFSFLHNLNFFFFQENTFKIIFDPWIDLVTHFRGPIPRLGITFLTDDCPQYVQYHKTNNVKLQWLVNLFLFIHLVISQSTEN